MSELHDEINSIEGVPTSPIWDWNTPFTIKEFVEHFNMGDPQDPVLSKRIGKELTAKGYTRRFHKRKYRWSKSWPVDVAMPDIP